MLKTILFDLDGTLLPVETERFVHDYMKALTVYVGDRVPAGRLVEQVLASTTKMIENTDPSVTNAEVFAADFFTNLGIPTEELMPVFDDFYRERFPELKTMCQGIPGLARELAQTALDQGYEIALATNPVFPREAIEERMRWVQVDDLPWSLVTTYEIMHAAKPQQAYFQEVLQRLGRKPEECMMVGNDVEEDGVAGRLGMDVHFVTDFLINRSGRSLPPGKFSTMAELLKRWKENGVAYGTN